MYDGERDWDLSEADGVVGVVGSTMFIWEFNQWQDGKQKKRFAQMVFGGLDGGMDGLGSWIGYNVYFGILWYSVLDHRYISATAHRAWGIYRGNQCNLHMQ